MMKKIDFDRLIPETDIKGIDEQETQEIMELLKNAKDFIKGHVWCPDIIKSYLGIGIGGVLGVFLFRFSKKINGMVDLLWVIEGDLPSAYLVVDEAPDAVTALEVYSGLMENWANAVLKGESTKNCFPVNVPSDKKYAKMLRTRINLIRNDIIPKFKI